MNTRRKQHRDWRLIRIAFERNDCSIRALSRAIGIPCSTISYRAKIGGWQRAARPDLRHRDNPQIWGDPPGDSARRRNQKRIADSPPVKTIDHTRKIDVNSCFPAAAAQIGKDLPEMIRRQQHLVARMLDELSAISEHHDAVERWIIAETAFDKDQRRRQRYLRSVGLDSRAGVLVKLAAAHRTLVEAAKTGLKERQQAAAAQASSSGRFTTPATPAALLRFTRRDDDGDAPA
jgi:hypothetical protein